VTRATDRRASWFALFAVVLAVVPSLALAQESPPAEAAAAPAAPAPAEPAPAPAASAPAASAPAPAPPNAFTVLGLRPAPPDIAAYPARPSAQRAPSERGVELHGFVAAWVTPWAETSPVSARDTYRLRFGVLRVDARPATDVTVLARLGLMVPNNPLLDFAVSYTPHDAFGVTAGQFRIPIGAAATTLAPQLVLLDRPSYVYAMTKLAFRDVGVMVHSGPRGIANGVFHYRLAAMSGAGRAGVGTNRPPDDLTESLLAARALVDLGRFFSDGPNDRLALGASYVRSTDPAIDSGDPARDRELAANVLGRTLAPIGVERVTQLSGADLTFSYGPFYSQAELLYLRSEARDHSERREGLGANLDLAYTLPVRPWNAFDVQLAARGEHFNPRLDPGRNDLPKDDLQLAALGVNLIQGVVRASVFGSVTFFEDATTGQCTRAGDISLRTSAAF
jgi:hypothetical protein